MDGRVLCHVVLLMVASCSAGYFYPPTCNYTQFVPAGPHAFYVYSPGYPEPYQTPIDCHWVLTSAENSRLVLDCEKMDMSASAECKTDYILIEDFTDSSKRVQKEFHCGQDSFTVVSQSNQLTVSLHAERGSNGGHFLCSLGAQVPQTRMLTQADETESQRQFIFTDTCDCGWSNGFRIVDGIETGVNEFPFMAGLIDAKLRHLICGATMITAFFALTAAHCLKEKQVNQLAVLYGEHDLSTGLDNNVTQLIRVFRMYIHPQYDKINEVNDIAILELVVPVTQSISVGPVCLPFRYSNANFIGEEVTILGWGTTEFGGPPSDTLQKVAVRVVSSLRCLDSYGGKFSPVRGLCTYAKGKDACQADSGGPLLWFDPDSLRYDLVGIVSYGRGCATEVPAANTKVGPYLLWIRQVTRGEYCIK